MWFFYRLILLTALLTVLGILVPVVPAQAQTPIDLQLSGEGAIAWTIGNLKPGDSGSEMLTLRNAGELTGFVTIWASNIVDTEGDNPPSETGDTAEPGELSQYLRFSTSASRLSTNVNLPAKLRDLPQSETDSRFIHISPIAPGETIDLVWQWQLVPEADNRAQGDRVTFTINYTMGEMPVTSTSESDTPPPPPGPPVLLEILSPGETTGLQVLSDGTVTSTQTVFAAQDKIILTLERGTRIATAGGEVPALLAVREIEETTAAEIAPLPPGLDYVSPIYDLAVYSSRGEERATFSQPIKLILSYDPKALPQDAVDVFIAYHDRESDEWVQLEPIPGFIAEKGQVGGLVSHFTYFTVMAAAAPVVPPELPAPPPPPPNPIPTEPVIKPPAPASFTISRLEITPQQVSPGDTVAIRVQIDNTGGMSGESSVVLKVNNLFIDSKSVRLSPGQNRIISFTVTLDRPGTYVVQIGETSGGFVVTEGETLPVPGGMSRNWFIAGLTGVLVLIVCGFALLLARRR